MISCFSQKTIFIYILLVLDYKGNIPLIYDFYFVKFLSLY